MAKTKKVEQADAASTDARVAVNSAADDATRIAAKTAQSGIQAQEPRFIEIRKNEDMYNGVNPPAPKGRSNVPFDSVVMGGFIDTLLAGVDEPISVNFDPTREQDRERADKISAVWQREAGPSRGDWNTKVFDTKKLAALAGRTHLKLYATSVPRFCTDLEVVDHYDMVTEPQGGADLDKHLFKHQLNIFRSESELLGGVGDGYYNRIQVHKLMRAYQPTDFKQVTDDFNNKVGRLQKLGVDITVNNYIGSKLYRLVESVIKINGKWFYLVWSYEAKTWVRFEPLEDVFEHAKEYEGRGPWTSWATHRDPFVYWSKAPADDVRPVAYTMKKVVNLTLDNLEKRNWDQKAYDPRIFTDPTQLLWRQDGLVRATLRPGMDDIRKGIFQFQTPDTTSITINLTQWLDNFLGQKTGITPDAQGSSSAQQVGILVNNLEQVSKRLRLTNRMFSKSLTDLGVMFDYACYEHLREKYAVKLIGTKGAEWDVEVTRKDVEPDFTVTVSAGDDAKAADLLSAQKKEAALSRIEKNPAVMQRINPNWYLRQVLSMGGFDDEAIRVALDTNNDGDPEILSEAAEAIQDILEGRVPRPNRGATTGYVRKILDFAYDHDELDKAVFDKLIAFAEANVPLAQANMERKAVTIIATARANALMGRIGGAPGGGPGPAAPGNPVEATPGTGGAVPGPVISG